MNGDSISSELTDSAGTERRQTMAYTAHLHWLSSPTFWHTEHVPCFLACCACIGWSSQRVQLLSGSSCFDGTLQLPGKVRAFQKARKKVVRGVRQSAPGMYSAETNSQTLSSRLQLSRGCLAACPGKCISEQPAAAATECSYELITGSPWSWARAAEQPFWICAAAEAAAPP